jgi:predicted site-specific integrase-resolvase
MISNDMHADADAIEAVRDLPLLVPIAKVADLFGVSDRTCRTWARTPGKLRVCKTARGGSGRVFVTRGEIARVLTAMRQRHMFDTK